MVARVAGGHSLETATQQALDLCRAQEHGSEVSAALEQALSSPAGATVDARVHRVVGWGMGGGGGAFHLRVLRAHSYRLS